MNKEEFLVYKLTTLKRNSVYNNAENFFYSQNNVYTGSVKRNSFNKL